MIDATTQTLMLNGIDYDFKISLINEDKAIGLPKTLFSELFIEESFTRWGFEGYLVYDNSYEQLERYKKNSKVKNSEFFYFRMDGTDEITIELTPRLDPTTDKSNKSLGEFPVGVLSLTLHGSIYNTEDISNDVIGNKQKKIYFWDYSYNKARNLNQRVSCGEYMNSENFKKKQKVKKDVTLMSNRDRSVLNGDLLKYICESKLEVEADSEFWDSGDKASFYTSPPTSTVYDDIEYLRRDMFDTNGYPMHFNFDRFTNLFKLVSYKTIFDAYDKSLREVFKFSDPTAPNSGIVPVRSLDTNTFSLGEFSDILKYTYDKMSAGDSIKYLNSTLLSGYASTSKKFLTNSTQADIEHIKETYKGLLANFPTGNQNPLVVLNADKIANKNVRVQQALEFDCACKDTIDACLMLNDAIHIESIGIPNRTPGTFIEITSDSDTQGIWEDRFLGTWFVTGVKHIIKPDGYVNHLMAVKPNMSESFKYPDGTEVEKQTFETVDVGGA